MVYVAIYTGLRVSELAGLRWDDIHEDSITIDERYCRGDRAPQSDCSNATIAVNRCVVERIHRLKILTIRVRAGRAVRIYRAVKSDGPKDLVFQSVKDGKPIRDNNILARFIKPAARKLELGWVHWRSLRTSHAVCLKMAGADVKDAQGADAPLSGIDHYGLFRFQTLSDETIKAKPTRIVSVRERRLNSTGKAITSSFGCEAPPTMAIRFRIPLPRVTA